AEGQLGGGRRVDGHGGEAGDGTGGGAGGRALLAAGTDQRGPAGERVRAGVGGLEGVVGGQHHRGVGVGRGEGHGAGVADRRLPERIHRGHGHVEGRAGRDRGR